MEPTTIPAELRRASERWPTEVALQENDQVLSFSGLESAAHLCARGLMASGVERGDRILLYAPNSTRWVVAALATLCAGGAIVPVNTRFKAAEVHDLVRRYRPRLILTVGEFLGTNYARSLSDVAPPESPPMFLLEGDAPAACSWTELVDRAAGVSPPELAERMHGVSADDVSDILSTSGTTGRPKGVLCTHGQNLAVYRSWGEGVGLRSGDRYLLSGPFSHSFGTKAGWLACLVHGATGIPTATFEPGAVLDQIGTQRLSVIAGTPTVFQSLLAHESRPGADLSSLRLAITGGAPVPVDLVRRMRSELGFEAVVTAYGLTEVCGTATLCRPTDDDETVAHTAGRALAGTEVRCVDPSTGEPQPAGAPGEVVVRGYNVMRGYFEAPAETEATIDGEGWLHTGDIGVVDDAGYLRITDRIKDLIIVGGFNVYPAEVENVLFEHEAVATVSVIGVPDERMGEIVMAFVELAPRPRGTRPPSADDLIQWARQRMANYKAPRALRIVDEIPLGSTGKADKIRLRELFLEA